jgi:hypothetical protein
VESKDLAKVNLDVQNNGEHDNNDRWRKMSENFKADMISEYTGGGDVNDNVEPFEIGD